MYPPNVLSLLDFDARSGASWSLSIKLCMRRVPWGPKGSVPDALAVRVFLNFCYKCFALSPTMGKGYNAAIASNPYIVGSFACIGGGLFGLDISSMSGVLSNDAYKNTFGNPGPNAQGAIVAAMPAGSFVGALAVTKLGDKLGRKLTVILSGWIWVIGSILQCAAVNRGMLVVGRIISGIAVGIASAIVPLYQSEVTEPSIRGRLVSMQQWSITWGILLQYFVEFGCSYINGTASFRIPWGLQMIPAIILSLGMMVFPESPRWLVDHDRESDALEILADLHGHGDPNSELVQLEITEIKQQVTFERTEGAKSYLDLLKPGILRRVGLGASLQMWSQLTGMNIMMYYIIYVFQGAGLTGRRGNLIADSVQYVLNVALTVPAIIYIDKWGRRPMLLVGTMLMGFWLMLVGGLQGRFGAWGEVDGSRVWVITGHDAATKAIIVCSYLFVCSFAITMGPVSWTYPAEIFPMRVRSKAVSISTATNWVFNFALAWAVPPGLSTIAYKTYFIFGTFNFAAFIHILFCFPETAGRSLEEIEEVFEQGHAFTAWRVRRDVGKKTLQDVVGKGKGIHEVEHVESRDEKV
ncbi:High-affinity glucose transporter [Grifola frondosa]|uniref:High-affinity glucose transporter n=1 Tax=Grifola frondosa TaxID=5627 RepID=A0A1C7MFG3_GRIFR|nr:High-affinity glucose transporter [Grifola frondosa]